MLAIFNNKINIYITIIVQKFIILSKFINLPVTLRLCRFLKQIKYKKSMRLLSRINKINKSG